MHLRTNHFVIIYNLVVLFIFPSFNSMSLLFSSSQFCLGPFSFTFFSSLDWSIESFFLSLSLCQLLCPSSATYMLAIYYQPLISYERWWLSFCILFGCKIKMLLFCYPKRNYINDQRSCPFDLPMFYLICAEDMVLPYCYRCFWYVYCYEHIHVGRVYFASVCIFILLFLLFLFQFVQFIPALGTIALVNRDWRW